MPFDVTENGIQIQAPSPERNNPLDGATLVLYVHSVLPQNNSGAGQGWGDGCRNGDVVCGISFINSLPISNPGSFSVDVALVDAPLVKGFTEF